MMKIVAKQKDLFKRVVSIFERARANVVQTVNSNMVVAYWLIGKEIVEVVQQGDERAEYGGKIIEELSQKLNGRYKSGFSIANLRNFRQLYLAYPERVMKRYPLGSEFELVEKPYPLGSDFKEIQTPVLEENELKSQGLVEFSPQLSWSHYRALMRLNNKSSREFYEREAIVSGWSKRTLERHIHSQYYERRLQSQRPELMKQGIVKESVEPAIEILKNPYVLEFLNLPEANVLHETELETAIITHLQSFMMELGKGFAFVGRQKRLTYQATELYVDLVFYNCILKFYLLVDLKIGELSHRDVGQMDSYVRMFEDLYTVKDDNPTIGLILCTEKNEVVAKYSVLSERKQIFASKYLLYLPTEEELKNELSKERKLIEEHLQKRGKNEDSHF